MAILALAAYPLRAVLALAALGCAGTGDPYRMPLPGYDRAQCRELGPAEGYAVGRLLSYIPFGMKDVIERATQEAIAKNNGNAITDVVTVERYSLSPIFISHGIRVSGIVLRCGPRAEPESDYERGRREERERIELERPR
jgi:hypothetical protein